MSATAVKREITRADILSPEDYEKIRPERRRHLVAVKKNRRLPVGPHATFYFENWDTMWMQIHEMLRIEKGGEPQISDELHAYNPLVPKGRELVATVMLEIDDAERRNAILSRLGGVERRMMIQVGGETVSGVPEADIERTNQDGKTSSVHFLHFPFTAEQIACFRDPAVPVMVGITHPEYGHMAIMPAAMRTELAADFD
jgi:hypothetical protein